MNPTAKANAKAELLRNVDTALSYGISANTTQEQLEELAVQLAKQKHGDQWQQKLAGMIWYVNSLYDAMALDTQEYFKRLYRSALTQVSEADEEFFDEIEDLKKSVNS